MLSSSCAVSRQILLPVSRIYAVPRECYTSFVWLMEACKQMDIEVEEITFMSTDAGDFVSAEGAVRAEQRVARFLVSECWSPGFMKVYILLGSKRYCVHSHGTEPTYPLDGVMSAVSEDDIEAMIGAIDGMDIV